MAAKDSEIMVLKAK